MIFKNGFTIKVAQDRCLNTRHYMVECNHCVQQCPTNAIYIHNTQVYLDKEKCSGCGVCLSDCPTQVFDSGQWDETNIIKNVQVHQWDTTEFFCANHTSNYKISNDEKTGAVQIPACLSSISRGTWFEIGLSTAIELHVDQCENCPMNTTLARLDYNIGVAAEWLASCGYQSNIGYITETENRRKKKSLRARQVGLKVTKRRDFFVSLAEFTKDVATTSYTKPSKQILFESCLPEWWKRFTESYPENIKENSSVTYWPVITITDECVSCGICHDFCPSKTLEIVEQDGRWTLRFSSGLCLDCRICQMICPKEAIIRDRELVEKPFEAIEIISREVIKCGRCGDMFPNNGDQYCHWCMEEIAVANDFTQLCKDIFLFSEKSIAE